MAERLHYAVVDGPPADWCGLQIIDLQTGREVRQVVEVSTLFECGWVRKACERADGSLYLDATGEAFAEETIYGRFEIRRPEARG